MKKIIITAIMIVMVVAPVFLIGSNANAGDVNNMLWGGYQDEIEAETGLGNTDPRVIASSVVNIILGFLGIIAVLLILYGGFKWMTAAGNDDNISTAKKTIGAGVIGLVIILAAFGIAQFVINALYEATGANG